MGMILSTPPFHSAFQIPNLSAASVPLISGSITTAVFCWSGIDGQKPASASSALLGSVSRAQSFIQIGSEHTHEGHIKHSLDDDWCHAVRTLNSCVLQRGVCHCHPAVAFCKVFNLREAPAEKGRNILRCPFELRGVELFCKSSHGPLVFSQGVIQISQHCQNPQMLPACFVLRVSKCRYRADTKCSGIRIGINEGFFREHPFNPFYGIG